MEPRHVVNFKVGDRVNYIDPHDDAVGTVIDIKRHDPGDLPILTVQYLGHVFSCHVEAFTFVERGQHVQKQVDH